MVERIRELCKKNGITINQLEKEVGFGVGTISKWDKSSPKVKSIALVAEALGVTIDYLFYGEKIPAPFDGNGLKAEAYMRLLLLTPEEVQRVDDFVQGILAGRGA